MIGARSGAATSVTSSSRCWRARAPAGRRRSATVAGVASTPTLPDSVIAAAISASGSITVTTSTPASAAISRAASWPAEVAELQAITSSFAPRSSRKRVSCSTCARSSSGGSRSVRETARVAQVDIVLLGQRDEALVQHGEPADPRVEHRDRQHRRSAQGPSGAGVGAAVSSAPPLVLGAALLLHQPASAKARATSSTSRREQPGADSRCGHLRRAGAELAARSPSRAGQVGDHGRRRPARAPRAG